MKREKRSITAAELETVKGGERCMRGGGGSVGVSVNDEGTRDEPRRAGARRGCKV